MSSPRSRGKLGLNLGQFGQIDTRQIQSQYLARSMRPVGLLSSPFIGGPVFPIGADCRQFKPILDLRTHCTSGRLVSGSHYCYTSQNHGKNLFIQYQYQSKTFYVCNLFCIFFFCIFTAPSRRMEGSK